MRSESQEPLNFIWEIVSATTLGINLQLNFDQPIEIMNSDLLEITLNFNSFEPSMPDGL